MVIDPGVDLGGGPSGLSRSKGGTVLRVNTHHHVSKFNNKKDMVTSKGPEYLQIAATAISIGARREVAKRINLASPRS